MSIPSRRLDLRKLSFPVVCCNPLQTSRPAPIRWWRRSSGGFYYTRRILGGQELCPRHKSLPFCGWEVRLRGPLRFLPRPAAFCFFMYLLYLDDSGSVSNPQDTHIILAGIAIFERQVHWLSNSLERLAEGLWPSNPESLEFRGNDILTGKKHWRGIGRADRVQGYRNALTLISQVSQAPLFAAAVNKAFVSPNDPMESAFEQICNRFDRYLGRLHKQSNTQRGLIILDKSTYETSLQGLARNFRTIGHRWGQLYNLADVPLFVDSRATRLIQCADMVAYAVRRYYERDEREYLDIIASKFDGQGGTLHGLIHLTGARCDCISCRQRQFSP